MLIAKALETGNRDFDGARRRICQHVGRTTRLQQRHFAERHAGGQRREPDAVRQRDVNDPAAEEEQRGRGVAGSDDLLAGSIVPDRTKRSESGKFFAGKARQQRLLGKCGHIAEIDRSAVAINHLVFGPFDRGIEQIEVAQIG